MYNCPQEMSLDTEDYKFKMKTSGDVEEMS